MSYETFLRDRAERDDALVVLTAENRAAIRGLPPLLGDRFIDVGICEQTMVGVAAGLALRGRTPVCHALATFLCFRAYEFIRDDVGIPGLPVILVGGVPGFLSDANGPTHQAVEDVSLMRGIPGMHVVCPSDEEDLLGAMGALLDARVPAYVRYYAGETAVAHKTPFTLGKAERLREGSDVTLLVHGFLLKEAAVAAEALEKSGVSTRLVNVRTVWPIDEAEVLAAARETRLVVTLEDHFVTGGLFSVVAERLSRLHVPARLHPIALEGRWFRPALLPDVLRVEGFTGPQIAARIVVALGEI